jgi:heat shock protein HtpX
VHTFGRMPKYLAFSANYARTSLLMAFLVGVLAIGGHMIGGMTGMLLFGVIGLGMNIGMYWYSDRIALLVHRAREVSPTEAPSLHRLVERLANRAGIPKPRVYVIPSQSPNAFATGRNPEHAVVAVTEGLMQLLSERELGGVVAHELGHIRNRDILIQTIAAGIAGLVAATGHVIEWSLLFAGGRDDDEGGIGMVGAIAWAILAPLISMLIQFAISRSREYGADATGAAICGDPDALADALARLEDGKRVAPYEHAGPATAHLFIVSPLRSGRLGSTFASVLSTHPPIEERIRRLRAMRA